MLRALLRGLLRLHLRYPRVLAVLLLALTLLLGWGAFRVERHFDLLALLPRQNPVVRNSLRAGVGTEELLWLVTEGTAGDQDLRKKWLEGLAERLCTDQVPLNGLSPEGGLASPVSVPGPQGAALWPPLMAAGALAAGDEEILKVLGQKAYGLAPLILGDRLRPLLEGGAAAEALTRTVADLRGLDPLRARLAILDPLNLRAGLDLAGLKTALGPATTPSFRLGGATTLTSRDGRWALLPLVLRFPTDRTRSTTAVVAWLAQGARGSLPARVSLGTMEAALAPTAERHFPLQVTGAHPIAAYENSQLSREVAWSLLLSFVLIGLVYALGFRTLAGYGFIVAPLLLGILWGLGLLGLLFGRLNLVVAVFGVVLLGVGDDVGILLFSRYQEARRFGCPQALALKSMLVGTGPGVLGGGLSLVAAFLAFGLSPLPALREVGLTIGLGFLTCLAATFLAMPALLLALDRGGRLSWKPARPEVAHSARWRPWLALACCGLAAIGVFRLRWEENLRALRRSENPAMALQERLGQAAGTGLQALALHLDLGSPETLPNTWNLAARALRREGLPFPSWQPPSPELRDLLEAKGWQSDLLRQAADLGLDKALVQGRLQALQSGLRDPVRTLAAFGMPGPPALQMPLRLSEAAQDRVQAELAGSRALLVGTRPMAQALKALAKEGLWRALGGAVLALALMVAALGRSWRFGLLALVPILASVLGSLGALGLAGVPLGFLSLSALPIAMAVGVDLTMNLLHRARLDPEAPRKLGRVNAVCAGTTLAGFGGLLVSGHAGLRGLGLAAFGGTALALLAAQWLLPTLLDRWPLSGPRP